MPHVDANRAEHNNLKQTFAALCRTRALDYHQGRRALIPAVDSLYDWAFTRGLIDAIGDDAVQEVMSDAFRPYREG